MEMAQPAPMVNLPRSPLHIFRGISDITIAILVYQSLINNSNRISMK